MDVAKAPHQYTRRQVRVSGIFPVTPKPVTQQKKSAVEQVVRVRVSGVSPVAPDDPVPVLPMILYVVA